MNAVYTCTVCDERKPEPEFYKNKGKVMTPCKECFKARVRANYRKNHQHYIDYERERTQRPERKKAALEYQRTRRARHPEKTSARARVAYAVRTGKMPPLPCESCGALDVQAHHDDYSKPLDVRWLCFAHHRAVHGQDVASPKGAKTFRAKEEAA